MATYIDGIAASENLDSSGEIVRIAGMDISSLTVDGIFNYEHDSKSPASVVGKVLKAKKIFSEKDCEDDRELYFWNKCKTPYVYCMGELFDDYKDSAKEVAGMFRYDADKKGQNAKNVMNFSIEGGKIDTKGMEVLKSVARKITLTTLPCNKQAVAEMVPAQQNKPKDDIDSIFKTETSVEIELFKAEDHPKILEMLKKEDMQKHADKLGIKPMKKENGLDAGGASSALSGGAPSSPSLSASEKGVHPSFDVPGKQRKAGQKFGDQADYNSQKERINAHKDNLSTLKAMPKPNLTKAANLKTASSQGTKIGTTTTKKDVFSHGKVGDYNFSPKEHDEASDIHNKLAAQSKTNSQREFHAGKAALHAGRAKTLRSKKEIATAPKVSLPPPKPSSSAIPNYDQTFHPEISGKMKPPGPIKKAMEAGSGMAAPSALTQGAALAKESLDKKIKKSNWLARAEEEFNKWAKAEEFVNFMSQKMPNLAKGEVIAIGQTIALKKSLEAELTLAKMAGLEKGEKPIHEGVHEFEGQKHHVAIYKQRKGKYIAHASPGEAFISAPGSKHTMHFTHVPEKNGFKVSHETPYMHDGGSKSATSNAIRAFASDKVKEHVSKK